MWFPWSQEDEPHFEAVLIIDMVDDKDYQFYTVSASNSQGSSDMVINLVGMFIAEKQVLCGQYFDRCSNVYNSLSFYKTGLVLNSELNT